MQQGLGSRGGARSGTANLAFGRDGIERPQVFGQLSRAILQDICQEALRVICGQGFTFGMKQRFQGVASRGLLRERPEAGQFRAQIATAEQNPQPVLIGEVEGRFARGKLCPVAPDPEVAFPHLGIVKQDDRRFRQLGYPAFVIFLDVFVEMPAVDVQQIDGAVRDVCKGLREGLAKKGAERTVGGVFGLNPGENLIAIEAGMLVALPRIHSETARFEIGLPNRFAETEIGIAVMRPQFDDPLRPGGLDEPHGERAMPQPRGHRNVRRARNGVIEEQGHHEALHDRHCLPLALLDKRRARNVPDPYRRRQRQIRAHLPFPGLGPVFVAACQAVAKLGEGTSGAFRAAFPARRRVN